MFPYSCRKSYSYSINSSLKICLHSVLALLKLSLVHWALFLSIAKPIICVGKVIVHHLKTCWVKRSQVLGNLFLQSQWAAPFKGNNEICVWRISEPYNSRPSAIVSFVFSSFTSSDITYSKFLFMNFRCTLPARFIYQKKIRMVLMIIMLILLFLRAEVHFIRIMKCFRTCIAVWLVTSRSY